MLAIQEGLKDGELAVVEAEADQIGAIAGIKPALARRDPADASGIPGGERDGFAQVRPAVRITFAMARSM